MTLTDYINRNRISVYSLSKKSGVPYPTCYNLAKGKSNIDECRVGTIKKIASALNVNADQIINNCLPNLVKHNFINDDVYLDTGSLPASLKNHLRELEELDARNDPLFYAMADSMLVDADREEYEGKISKSTLAKLYDKYPTD